MFWLKKNSFLRVVVIFGFLLSSFIFSGASETNTEPGIDPGTIEFLDGDETPITITIEKTNENPPIDLNKLEFPIQVHVMNFYDAPEGTSFTITAQIIFDNIDPQDNAYLPSVLVDDCFPENEKLVDSSETIELNLVFTESDACTPNTTDTKVKAGTYSGTIIVSGPSNVIRKNISIEIIETAGDEADNDDMEISVRDQLAVKGAITFQATRFVPAKVTKNLINILFIIAIVLTILSILAGLISINKKIENPKPLKKLKDILANVPLLIVFCIVTFILLSVSLWQSKTHFGCSSEGDRSDCLVVESIPITQQGKASEQPDQTAEDKETLITDQGTMTLSWNANEIDLTPDFAQAGSHTGTVYMWPDDEKEKGKVTVNLNVADYWFYALTVITVGVLIGYGVSHFHGYERTRLIRLIKIDDIKKQFCSNYEGLDDENIKDAYKGEKENFENELSEFEKSAPVLAEDKFLNKVKEIETKAASYLEKWEKLKQLQIMYSTIGDFENQYSNLIQRYQNFDAETEFQGYEFENLYAVKEMKKFTENLKDNLPSTPEIVDNIIMLIDKIILSLKFISYDLKPLKPDLDNETQKFIRQQKNIIEDNIKSLLREENSDNIEKYRDAALTALINLNDYWESAREPISYGITTEDGSREVDSWGAEEEEEKPPKLLEKELIVGDVLISIVSGLLAIGTGVALLYTSTWGSWLDYLTALLWGSTVSEGIKYFGSLVAKLSK